jgi:hypothetical protein
VLNRHTVPSADNVVLRKYEVQVTYNAAFTFWSVKGILADRWAHTEFGGVADQGNQIALSEDHARVWEPSAGSKSAIAGLITSLFIADEVDNPSRFQSLALDWFKECFDMLKPKLTHTLRVREFSVLYLDGLEEVRQKLEELDLSSGLHNLLPSEYGSVLSGGSFNAARKLQGGERIISCQYGGMRPDMAQGYFGSVRDCDSRPGIGLAIEHTERFLAGFRDPHDSLRKLLTAAHSEATTLVGRALRGWGP